MPNPDSPAQHVEAQIQANAPTLSLEKKHVITLSKDAAERTTLRNTAKKLSKEKLQQLSQSIETHHIDLQSDVAEGGAATQNDLDGLKEVKTLADDLKKDANEDDEGLSRGQKISRGAERVWDKTKDFAKSLGSLKTWQDWMDKGIDGVVDLYKTVTNWLKTSIAPVMTKLGMKVPDWMKPAPKELQDVQVSMKELKGKTKIVVELGDPNTELGAARELKKKERQWIKEKGSKKEDFYLAVAKQMEKEDDKKESATVEELLEAAKIILPDGASPSKPNFDSLKENENLIGKGIQKIDVGGTNYDTVFSDTGMAVNGKALAKMKIKPQESEEQKIQTVMRKGTSLEIKVKETSSGTERTIALTKAQAEDAIKKMSDEKTFDGSASGVSFKIEK